MSRHGITLLQTVPSMMRSLLDACGAATDLGRLRWLVPTGEALPLNIAQEWFGHFPGIPLMNVYGPAECSDDVTYQALYQRPEDGSGIPIGRPTPNNRIYIVDRHLRPVPVGVVGEICVGGVGVGRGYLNNPEQTAAAFVPHPFCPGERFYRTGDLGRYRADGVIEFAGRRDYQIKLRGFRIELGEIEVKLCTCDGVRDAIVVAREDQPGDKRLVAYVVPQEGAAPTAAQLRLQLLAMVADYMVPSAFVSLEAFPLTPNGKIDRKALPAPDQSALPQRQYEAPQGEVEQALAQLWQDLLGLEQVGRRDSFFELGGHSLLATQLVLRVRQALDVELPLMKVFQAPTLSAMGEEISALKVGQFEESDVARIEAEMDDMSAADLQAWLDQN
ncbi:AMP-binding protein [Janthinobacterium lividum]|uniref:AMP-binding protein n=1 Tax=Janthinobacterium lividum TaxID=29581 RepID=UPI0015951FB6|nr:AMP-binding protein [Janthinobacterium lividum]QKY12015.1 AMP-binding protein [Janthinobacterium lividum]